MCCLQQLFPAHPEAEKGMEASWARNLPMILNWVKAQKPGVMGVNIITSDFVELVDFAATVIALNDLLLEEDESDT